MNEDLESKDDDDTKKKRPGCVVWGLVFVALVVIWALIVDPGPDDDEVDAYSAQRQCQDWVEEQLRAPATAEFSNQDVTVTGTNAWEVTGDVDAENGFGALVRNEWTCTIRLDGDTWRGSVNVR